MLDYEEYYFFAQQRGIKFDYQKMADMILDKKTDLVFWEQITVYELMDYTFILCDFWEGFCTETFKSEQNKMDNYVKVSDDLKMCYKVFCEKYSKNSDAVAVFGYILQRYYLTLMITQALTETVTNHDDTIIMDAASELILKACKMKNPIACAIHESDIAGVESNFESEESKVKSEEAVQYIKTHFPKESVTVELLNWYFT